MTTRRAWALIAVLVIILVLLPEPWVAWLSVAAILLLGAGLILAGLTVVLLAWVAHVESCWSRTDQAHLDALLEGEDGRG